MTAYVLHLAFEAAVLTLYGLLAVVTLCIVGKIGQYLFEDDGE